VNGAGDELFAGARFAEDEDGVAAGATELDLGESALTPGCLR